MLPTGGPGYGDDVLEPPPISTGPSLASKVLDAAVGVAKTAVGVLKKGHFPLALLVIIGGFLIFQGMIDRRDPKLALARVREELSDFEDFPSVLRRSR